MKLNLGCGRCYLPGYVNIDAFDATVADEIGPAHILPYDSQTIERIEAHHLIEHLGYFVTRYALAEWFRVLQPNGTLLIETPDLDAAFKKYLTGSPTVKREVLTWIYGEDSLGMRHHLCYPQPLLSDLLRKSGFTIRDITRVRPIPSQPTLQVLCHKPTHAPVFQALAEARGRIRESNHLASSSAPVMLVHESFLDSCSDALRSFTRTHDTADLDSLFLKGAIICPASTKIIVEEAEAQGLIAESVAKPYLRVLDFLVSINSPTVLMSLLRQCPCLPGTQTQVMHTIMYLGEKSIQKLLANDEDSKAIEKTWIAISTEAHQAKTVMFCEETIEEAASILAYQAIRHASQGEVASAIEKFQEAIRFDRNRLLYYWNLGRLYATQGDLTLARASYKDAVGLLKNSKGKTAACARQRLQRESRSLPKIQWDGPVLEV